MRSDALNLQPERENMPKIKELEEPRVAAYVEKVRQATAKATITAAVRAAKEVTASHVAEMADKAQRKAHQQHGAQVVAAIRTVGPT